MNDILSAFTPNKVVSKSTVKLIVTVQAVVFILLWMFSPFALLPTIGEVWKAFAEPSSPSVGVQARQAFLDTARSIGKIVNVLRHCTAMKLEPISILDRLLTFVQGDV